MGTVLAYGVSASLYASGETCQGRDGTGLRAYDLRHAFGTELYAKSGDIRATQVLMGHSTPQLTHRYTLAAVDPRVQAAIAAMSGPAKVATTVATSEKNKVKRRK
jgi:integrase